MLGSTKVAISVIQGGQFFSKVSSDMDYLMISLEQADALIMDIKK